MRNDDRMSVSKTIAACVAAAGLLAASAAWAADGRLEIHQACVATGCFPGDTPGFPVSLATRGSYVLTSDLVVADANTTGIDIDTPGVTLDLNGFAVRGPVVCSRPTETFYQPGTITCTASGNGDGIYGATNTLIRNGAVYGFGRYGVLAGGALSSHTVVEDLRVEQNAQGGIYLNNGTVRRVNVTLNGADGITNVPAGDASEATVIEDSNIAFNKGNGIGLAAKVRNVRVSYNGGAGLAHTNAGGQNCSISDSMFHRNVGNAINANGSYRDNEIRSNGTTNGGQVIGNMSDEGGNNVH